MSPVRTAPFPDPKPSPHPKRSSVAEQVALAEQLYQRLLTLDYPPFAGCICRLLEALGYEHAHLAGRRLWKGYNRPGGGGYDLEAVLPGGMAPRRVIVQIKQFEHLVVHQRSVDELRGACLRTGVAEGLLMTTSTFSDVVRRRVALPSFAATDLCGGLTIPVRLIDGQELLRLLIDYRIGVRECIGFRARSGVRTSLDTGHHSLIRRYLTLDEAFFAALYSTTRERAQSEMAKSRMPQSNSTKNNSAKSSSATDDHCPSSPRWRVTLRIFPDCISWSSSPAMRRGRQTSEDSHRNNQKKKRSDQKENEQKERHNKDNEQKGER